MTNTNKKNKNTRKLLGAIGMLSVSAAMLVSSTFAWFTMNKEVKATNMQVRALAEDGLLINETQGPGDTWDEEATAAQTASSKLSMLHPASTADGSTWYHAASTKYDNAAAATQGSGSSYLVNGYEQLGTLTAITEMSNATASAGSQAAFETMGATSGSAAGYYVHYRYYLKTSAQSTLTLDGTNKYVSIKSVVATPTTASGSGSAELDKSLRVGIKLNSDFYIYNPLNGTNSYYVAASNTATTTIAGTTITKTDLASLPAVSANGTPVDVYLWFEGEDADCKSSNATAQILDNIKVDITFSLTGAEAVPTT